MSIEKMSAKAKELKSKGHSTREICQEMHLSQATVEWLLVCLLYTSDAADE